MSKDSERDLRKQGRTLLDGLNIFPSGDPTIEGVKASIKLGLCALDGKNRIEEWCSEDGIGDHNATIFSDLLALLLYLSYDLVSSSGEERERRSENLPGLYTRALLAAYQVGRADGIYENSEDKNYDNEQDEEQNKDE